MLRSSSTRSYKKNKKVRYNTNRNRNNRANGIKTKRKMKGGNILNYAQFGIAEPNILVEVIISDETLCNFRRYKNSQMDCLINAMQLMGLIDIKAANLLRISYAGTNTGFTAEQISCIFMLYTNKFCLFRQIANIETFFSQIQLLTPGTVTLGGYTVSGLSHVFLIGKTQTGQLVYIDPRETVSTYCNLSEEQCYNILANKNVYYLLYRNDNILTEQQLTSLGFVNERTYQHICSSPTGTSAYGQLGAVEPLPPNPVDIQQQLEMSSNASDVITAQDVSQSVSEPIDMDEDEYDML